MPINIESEIVTKKEFNKIIQKLPLESVQVLKKLYEGRKLDLDEINHIQHALRQYYYSQVAYWEEVRFRKEDD